MNKIIEGNDGNKYTIEIATGDSPCNECYFRYSYSNCEKLIKQIFGYSDCKQLVGDNYITRKYIKKLLLSNIDLWKQEFRNNKYKIGGIK